MPHAFRLKHKTATGIFSRHISGLKALPDYTPLFAAEHDGRIIKSSPVCDDCEMFESIYELVDGDELDFAKMQHALTDAFAARSVLDDRMSLMVISKRKDFPFGCVVCSYSENGCDNLSDYVNKLLSYKAYINSFERLACSPSAQILIKSAFERRANGAMHLVDLALGKYGTENTVVFPIEQLLIKLCGCLPTKEAKISFDEKEIEKNAVAVVPEVFFSLAAGMLALVFRHSLDGIIHISVKGASKNAGATIHFDTHAGCAKKDIYEKELVGALEQRGLCCSTSRSNDRFTAMFDVPLKAASDLVFSESDIEDKINEIFGQSGLCDMLCTISSCGDGKGF